MCAICRKSRLGIDVEHDFEPKYITIRGKGELLASLRKAAKKQIKFISQLTLTARGEAISWHLSIALNLDENKDAPHHLQRDHKIQQSKRRSNRHARHRYEPGGRAAGAPLPRPYGRL